jgi:multidrug efflux pump subunit AcrB
VTPLMGAYLLKDKPPAPHTEDRLTRAYRPLLAWALKHRLTTLAVAAMFLVVSFMLVPLIPVGFFSKSDAGLSIVRMELPPGSTIEDTDRASLALTQKLLANSNVATVQTDQTPTVSTLYVKLKAPGQRVAQKDFEKQFRPEFASIPGVRLSFDSGGIGGGKELAIVLKSEDSVALTQVAESLEKQMRGIPGFVEVSSSASLVKPEILITPDPARAADQGVSVQTIARTANLATLGDTDANLAKFDLPDRQIPIRVQIDPKNRNSIETIRSLQVKTTSGALVPLQTVAKIEFGNGPSQIDRYNRARKISVEANLQGIALGDANTKVQALPALAKLPPTVRQEKFGNAKVMGELFGNIGAALGAAVLFIYVVLVLLFGDFLHPLTIMVALPFSIGGALMALLITQKELGLFALIGVVLLLGLVTKNSILLVDYTLLNQREGMPLYKALLESGAARLRPILMTTIAMVSGMMPIALGIGAGSETRAPMAITVIGGLITSTLLTLVVVPVIFSYVDSLQHVIFDRALKGSIQRRNSDIEVG